MRRNRSAYEVPVLEKESKLCGGEAPGSTSYTHALHAHDTAVLSSRARAGQMFPYSWVKGHAQCHFGSPAGEPIHETHWPMRGTPLC
ncbi:hypothetical protein BaRGS_00007562 [Batillaria attramentaria]|uniref:Uncharacterized protein n=1 Tax=Batillaria attramentaria TaxID=370345 RepID=A0ABD0LN99_9CAEN